MSGPIWLAFKVDGIAITLTFLFSLITIFSLIYSIFSIKKYSWKTEYFIILLLLAATGIGLLYGRNLILLFALWELNTFAVWRLVGFYREDWHVEFAERTFIINFFAAVLMMVGIGIIYSNTGTFNLDQLNGVHISNLAAYLILIGILTKSATIPLHVWLPYAYRSSPIPVGAMLAGVSENLGLILFLRLFRETFTVPDNFYFVVMIIAVASILVAGGAALVTDRLRAIVAYSTISQLGFIFLGLAAGGKYGVIGAVLYIIAHGLSKPGIFYALGIVEERSGGHQTLGDIGFGHVMPTLAPGFALLAGSIIGLPPFLGFFAKLYVIMGVIKINLVIAALAVGGALFTLLYLLRLYNGIFKGETKIKIVSSPISSMLVLVIILAILAIGTGILFIIPNQFVQGVIGSWL